MNNYSFDLFPQASEPSMIFFNISKLVHASPDLVSLVLSKAECGKDSAV